MLVLCYMFVSVNVMRCVECVWMMLFVVVLCV